MELVVDTNIMFSFFWKKSLTRKLLMDEKLILFSPEFSLEEIKKYEKEIIQKTNITKKEFNEIRRELAIAINFIPINEYKNFFKKAIVFSPDKKDIDFFALAIKLKIPLWSNDSQLKKQNYLIVYNTKEILTKKILEED